ncbi:MAG: DEAD/DEAH box helicase [Candidatus Paceibacterota bacterium]
MYKKFFRGQKSSNTRFVRRKRSSAPSGAGRSGGPRRRAGRGGEVIHPSRFIQKGASAEQVEVFVPEHTFFDFAISAELKQAIEKRGYSTPTPIQDGLIPYILKGKDVIGIANTGTGKTGAFLIPLLDKILHNRKEQILIMAPTRELAMQIDDELKALSRGLKVYSVCCVGGMNIGPQIRALRQFNNVVVGTPGRLKDLMEQRVLRLSAFHTLVLDEADRMLDMGFIDDMRFIVAAMPKKRHTLFFAATMSPEIEKLTKTFLTDPAHISVKKQDTSKNVDQDVVRVPRAVDKIDILRDLLIQDEFSKVLIFGRTKHGVEKLSKQLTKKGISATSIHGNKNHAQRQRALKQFKDESVRVLVATDVAARGLDIPNVTHVINFDVPATYDDYVHRIGRTGRGDKSGKALTFVE